MKIPSGAITIRESTQKWSQMIIIDDECENKNTHNERINYL